MKIRTGFVSNSSSSSFIVVFPKDPKSKEELQKMLFGDDKFFANPYYDPDYTSGEMYYDCDKVAETVWNDIKNQSKNNISGATEAITSGVIVNDNDAPDYDDYQHIKDWSDRIEAFNKDMSVYSKKKMNQMFNTRKNKLKRIDGEKTDDVFYIFEYSDNDGSYFSSLEHGGLFDRLKHIKISNH